MRVLLINHSPKQSGVALYASNLCRELRTEGIRVEIADISDPSGLGFVSSQAHRIRRSIEIANGLLRLPKGFDVYHATSQTISISHVLLKPTVVTIHDTAAFLTYKDVVAGLLFKMAFSFAKSAEMVICPSSFTREEAVSRLGVNPNRVVVIPLGVDHALFHRRDKGEARRRLSLQQNVKLILSVSTTLKHKNLPVLLRTLQLIRKKQPTARLVRVGAPNPTTLELSALAKQLGIAESITYMKPNNEELAILYNACDLFLHTSTYEGFGTPLVEAMASGLPVVASNATSIPEVVGDGGILIDPLDADGFASQATNVLTDEVLAKQMAERGIIRSQHFSWEKCAKDTLKTYEAAFRYETMF